MSEWLNPVVAAGIVAFIALAARSAWRQPVDPHIASAVGGSPLLGSRIRAWYLSYLEPIEERCVQWGLRPSDLSFAQLLISVVGAVVFAKGMLFTGGWLLLVTGSLDIVDGRLARRTDRASRRGAFLDSVIDRYADAFGFMGLAVYYRTSAFLWVTLVALVGSLLVSYTRARAEGLGQSCKVGLLQRPERYVLLGFGCIFSVLLARLSAPIAPIPDDLVLRVTLLFLAVVINLTALQRAIHVWRALGEEEAHHAH